MLALRRPSVLPGFGPTLGFALFYLSLVVLIPLAALFVRSAELGIEGFIAVVSTPRALAAFRLTFGAAFLASLVNAFFGLLLAWVLTRYRFPGRRIIDGLVDLPFALPTAVAGIALATLYAPNGWIGGLLDEIGVKVAYTPTGVFVALVFIGMPFVVRTIQPVLQDLDPEVEEASASLGAARWQTRRFVVFPVLLPALLTGFALGFARALGEYGTVIFIAGNLPGLSEIVPLLIFIQLEQYRYANAAAIATVMLVASFVLLLIINVLQRWTAKRHGDEG
jgi:sulfate transport system permease protein